MKSTLKIGLPIFLAAVNMRAGLVVINPLLPILKDEYHLSTFVQSLFSAIPLICFASTAIIMRYINRLGDTNRVITVALGVLAFSLFMRATFGIPTLLLFSISMGIAIATLNYMLPVWLKENGGNKSGLLTGTYVAIMGTCVSISLAIAVPLAHATSIGWRLSMVPWIITGTLAAIWWFIKMPHKSHNDNYQAAPHFFANPLLKNKSAWAITLFFGLISMVFYATSTWGPTILVSKGFTLTHSAWIVSISNLIGSVLGIFIPHYVSKKSDMRAALVFLSALIALSFLGVGLDHGNRIIIWMILANIGMAICFPLSLLLAVLRGSDPVQTRLLSIMMQSVGYLMAAVSPTIMGAIFDTSSSWPVALMFVVVLGVLQALISWEVGKSKKIAAV